MTNLGDFFEKIPKNFWFGTLSPHVGGATTGQKCPRNPATFAYMARLPVGLGHGHGLGEIGEILADDWISAGFGFHP